MLARALFASSRATSGSRIGVVRLGRRTKVLAPTLAPDSIVVLDHPDLDTVAAEALIRARPRAIINVQPFITGRYPNRGPLRLLDAGVPMLEARTDLFCVLSDGDPIQLNGTVLERTGGGVIEDLTLLTAAEIADRLARARANLDTELRRFAENTLHFLSRDEEKALLLDPVDVPNVAAPIAGRPVLVAVRGEGYAADLKRLRSYLRDIRPVVIAVDGAADALLDSGIRPHIILGDMDSVSDGALRCGAELLVHAYTKPRADGSSAPGMARIEALGLHALPFPIAGTSEDAALLLAYEKGADLIVAVGTHTNLEDFLDKGRGGMASTFLVRLKVGSRLVDARGVSRLYGGGRPSGPAFLILAVSALFPVAVLAASTPFGQIVSRATALWWRTLFR